MSFLGAFSFPKVTDQDVERVVDKEGLVFLFVAMAQADKLKRGTSLDPETVDHSVYFKTLDELLDEYRPLVTNVGSSKEARHTTRSRLEVHLETYIVPGSQGESLLTVVRKGVEHERQVHGSEAKQYTEMQMVLPGLYIGPYMPAHDRTLLRTHGITHVCCCIGVAPPFPNDFKYVTLPAADVPGQDMTQFFDETRRFIAEGIAEGGVLVHCGAGISRASTITICYLMHTLELSFDAALKLVKSKRPFVHPNAGFQRQLRQLQAKLETERGIKNMT